MAKRYGKLPSQLIDLAQEDLQIDYLCMEAGIKEEKRQAHKAQREASKHGSRKRF